MSHTRSCKVSDGDSTMIPIQICQAALARPSSDHSAEAQCHAGKHSEQKCQTDMARQQRTR